MEQVMEIIINGAISVLVVLIGLLFNYVRAFLVEKSEEIHTTRSAGEVELAKNIAITVVEAVEQIGGHMGWDNRTKLEEAMKRLAHELQRQGIPISETHANTLVESAVSQLDDTYDVLLDEITRDGEGIDNDGLY